MNKSLTDATNNIKSIHWHNIRANDSSPEPLALIPSRN